jgi:aminopeptidase N
MLRPERTCYDVTFYELEIKVDPERRELSGYVDIHFEAVEDFETLQIDLYQNMKISRIESEGKTLPFRRRHNAVFVTFPRQTAGSCGVFRVIYEGRPVEADNPPWDGGFVWATDGEDNPWVGVACEGDGASLWWPNKDHLSDEPDSMAIRVAVPRGLTCVANGRLRAVHDLGKWVRYDWFVSYPINNYNVTVNIARYAHIQDTFISADGDTLELDYYVLPANEAKARKHFQQVQPVLACFERFFGKYPFWNDGYALVETPFLGMEHQGAIAYGNRYMRGYLGGMIPRDMDWDYIIVHETGHEYFGNSISCGDLAEMWLHESFTTYMEALYVECTYGYEDAVRYLSSQRPFIYNQEPILGPFGVNWEDWAGNDHYYKGAWVLHTLRHVINDDAQWWDLLRKYYDKYALSIIRTSDFIDFVNAYTGRDFSSFFEQYLQYPELPVLEYSTTEKKGTLQLRCRWESPVEGFDMPLLAGRPGNWQQVHPTAGWQTFQIVGVKEKEFEIATDLFLIRTRKLR